MDRLTQLRNLIDSWRGRVMSDLEICDELDVFSDLTIDGKQPSELWLDGLDSIPIHALIHQASVLIRRMYANSSDIPKVAMVVEEDFYHVWIFN